VVMGDPGGDGAGILADRVWNWFGSRVCDGFPGVLRIG